MRLVVVVAAAAAAVVVVAVIVAAAVVVVLVYVVAVVVVVVAPAASAVVVCCVDSLSVCPTPVCIRTHKNDHIRTLKILYSMSEFDELRKHKKIQQTLC